jgi:type VII secretion integral membrane protein EccD
VHAALLAAAVAAAGAATAVTMARGGRHPALVGTIAAAALLTAGGLLGAVARLTATDVAGILIALIMPLGGWVPSMAFRLARMRLDPTPSSPEELQDDLDPVPGQFVLERTRWADRYMSGLYGGLAVVVTAGLIVLALGRTWPARAVAIDVIVLLLLHARVLASARHKLAAILPAVVGAAVLAAATGLRASDQHWPTIVAVLVVVAGILLVGERSLPEHKLLPHWGRAGDIFQTLTAAGLIPLVLWLLNLYHFARTVR